MYSAIVIGPRNVINFVSSFSMGVASVLVRFVDLMLVRCTRPDVSMSTLLSARLGLSLIVVKCLEETEAWRCGIKAGRRIRREIVRVERIITQQLLA